MNHRNGLPGVLLLAIGLVGCTPSAPRSEEQATAPEDTIPLLEEGEPPSTATRQVGEVMVTLQDELEPGRFRVASLTRQGAPLITVNAVSAGFEATDDLLTVFQEPDGDLVIILLEADLFPLKQVHAVRCGPQAAHALPNIDPMAIEFIADVDGDGRLEVGGDPVAGDRIADPADLLVLEIGDTAIEDPAALAAWSSRPR